MTLKPEERRREEILMPLSVSLRIPPKVGGKTRRPREIKMRSQSLRLPSLGKLRGASMAMRETFRLEHCSRISSSVKTVAVKHLLPSRNAIPVGLFSLPERSIPPTRTKIKKFLLLELLKEFALHETGGALRGGLLPKL